MTPEQVQISVRLGIALIIGGVIGLERELHGRPAGFRTHMLVCLASAVLMQIAVYPGGWLAQVSGDAVRIDPIRMAQGIMTGVGFLGAGEIFRQGWNIRGLTTAASIWVTAAIGIVCGIGMYFLAALSAAAALVVLLLLNWLEHHLPAERHVRYTVRFARGDIMDEGELRALLKNHGFAMSELSHGLTDGGRMFEYRMILRTRDRGAQDRLARTLRSTPKIIEFDISPRGD